MIYSDKGEERGLFRRGIRRHNVSAFIMRRPYQQGKGKQALAVCSALQPVKQVLCSGGL